MKLSIVTPVFRNEKTLEELIVRSLAASQSIYSEIEHILVVDGPIDNSFAHLKNLSSKFTHLKVILLVRNFGQHIAIRAGLDIARGDHILFLDADLDEHDENDADRTHGLLRDSELTQFRNQAGSVLGR
jgi:dolichol-phosphate mannosyltransferase